MQHKAKYLFTLLVLGLITWSATQAEVKHRQFNELNSITYVSNDSWQPENFDNGIVIPAGYVINPEITLDGLENELEWRNAQEVTVPMSFGNVSQVKLKAFYTDKDIIIRVRWPDTAANRDHHPWVWDTETETYVAGPQVEDSVMLSFEAGCEWTPSFLSGYVYDFDAWHWLAARTDPLGMALDLYGSMQDHDVKTQKFTKYDSRITEDHWQLKFTQNIDGLLNMNWDEMDRAYLFQPISETVYFRGDPDWDGTREYTKQLPAPVNAPDDPEEVFQQFLPVKLEGGSSEVAAKGHWEDGYWTVEFRRSRYTPARHIYDTIFNRIVQFSVHVFDQTDRIDQSSESARLFLRFLPQDKILVKD
jgi:hypothetical protein